MIQTQIIILNQIFKILQYTSRFKLNKFLSTRKIHFSLKNNNKILIQFWNIYYLKYFDYTSKTINKYTTE